MTLSTQLSKKIENETLKKYNFTIEADPEHESHAIEVTIESQS